MITSSDWPPMSSNTNTVRLSARSRPKHRTVRCPTRREATWCSRSNRAVVLALGRRDDGSLRTTGKPSATRVACSTRTSWSARSTRTV